MDAVLLEQYHRVLPQGAQPYSYQIEVGRRLLAGANLVLRAPTGSGKTLSALVPFLLAKQEGQYSRLIYALPLRTLVRSIGQEARTVVSTLAPGMEVTTQTGEDPEDPFFCKGDIIVCTYDQLLSGLLGCPYGLSSRLANVNAACIAGALVVFDEFHLMAPDRAFLTAAACLQLFGALTQSLWMSATATSALVRLLRDAVGAECIDLAETDWAALPCVSRVQRSVRYVSKPLTPEEILRYRGQRVVAIVNQVDWARDLFKALPTMADWPAKLLHSRFFRSDRAAKEEWLQNHFGKEGSSPALLICTQVIEAGVDITCDVLLTQLAPMNALIQRAGRCARFPPSGPGGVTQGQVVVYELPQEEGSHLPYGEADLDRSRLVLSEHMAAACAMDPATAQAWVEAAHAEADRLGTEEGWLRRQYEALERIRSNTCGRMGSAVSDLIRECDDSVRVVLADEPPEKPGDLEPLQLSRGRLRRLIQEQEGSVGYAYLPSELEESWVPLTQSTIGRCYYACLPLRVAAYDSDMGLVLGPPGAIGSPARAPREHPGYGTLDAETWEAHTRAVVTEACVRTGLELPRQGRAARALVQQLELTHEQLLQVVKAAALFHDFGKLQDPWYRWALAYMQDMEPSRAWSTPLAHTCYDARRPGDREREKRLAAQGFRKPPHAAPSAYFASWAGEAVLRPLPDALRVQTLSAVCAAIVGHHGGWIPPAEVTDLGCYPLTTFWKEVLPFLGRYGVEETMLAEAEAYRDKRRALQEVLDCVVSPDQLRGQWPLVALVTRVLRLSDQKATAEGGSDA